MRQLRIRTKLGFGVAEAGLVAVEVMIQLYVLKFYISEVGLRAELAGLCLAFAVLLDGFTDPLMGAISDRNRSSKGRRRVFILAGTFLLAAVFPLLFHPPALESQTFKFLFLLAAYTLVNLAMTVTAVPHAALGGELSDEPDIRTEVFGFRLLFGNLGLLVGTLVPGVILIVLKDSSGVAGQSRSYASLAVSALVLGSGIITYLATARHDGPAAIQDFRGAWQWFLGFAGSALGVLRNRVFLPLFAAFFVATIARTLNASVALLYYQHRLQLSEQDVILYVLGLFVAIISFSILFWVLISRRYGKKMPAFYGTLGLGVMTCVVYPLFPVGGLAGPLLAAVVGGFLVGSVVLLDSLVADIVDYDTLQTGFSREGLYYGFWKLAAKWARALGLALSGLAIAWTGFDHTIGAQPSGVSDRLAIIFGPGVGGLFVLAALIFLLLPWSARRHEQIRRALAKRAAK